MSRRHNLSIVVAAAVAVFAKSALAQLPPPAPPVAQPPAPAPLWSPGTPAAPTASVAPAAPTVAVVAAPAADDGTLDQERFIGHFGVTYFGVAQVPIATGLAQSGGSSTIINTPIIGARYWVQRSMGIDVGLGFGLFSGGADATTSGVTQSQDRPGTFAMAVHAGLPLVLGRGKHYAFELIPEANFGFATGSLKGAGGNGDTSISGSRIDLGGRVGAEIFFGFIGIPELALQASVGLFLHRTAFKASQDTLTSQSSSSSQMSIGTTVQADPWAIFANNISATYYF